MSLRCCKFCYKLATDEKHTWFCPFGDGISPLARRANPAQDGDGGNGGSEGGGGPGDRNIPPLPDSPGGGGVANDWGKLRAHAKPLSLLQEKTSMIEHKPMLALPPMEVKDKDEQRIRDNSVGKP